MYNRHQQAVTTSEPPQFYHNMHAWYSGYHHATHQGPQIPPPTAQTSSYCMQDEQNLWHHHPHPQAPAVFHAADYHSEFIPLQQQQQELPSPPITVSGGSEMSSPGGGGGGGNTGNVSPPQAHSRPVPVRSPYEWMSKSSYQTQPNPGKWCFFCGYKKAEFVFWCGFYFSSDSDKAVPIVSFVCLWCRKAYFCVLDWFRRILKKWL